FLAIVWLGFPVVGAVAGAVLALGLDWIVGLTWAPFQGPLSLVDEVTGAWTLPVFVAVGVVLGLVLALSAHGQVAWCRWSPVSSRSPRTVTSRRSRGARSPASSPRAVGSCCRTPPVAVGRAYAWRTCPGARSRRPSSATATSGSRRTRSTMPSRAGCPAPRRSRQGPTRSWRRDRRRWRRRTARTPRSFATSW